MIKQRTIRDTVSVEGAGLQTGNMVTVRFKGASENSGINFVRTDLPNKPILNLLNLTTTAGERPERRTTLGAGPIQIQTVEHLLAALSALAIDNITIELDNVELPGLDGSACEYLDILDKAGIVELKASQKVLKAESPVWCDGANGAFLAAFPSDNFRISYTLSYDCASIGAQYLDLAIDKETFAKHIAPARTFCLEEEALSLIKMGLGKGANYGNTLVMGPDGPVRNKLRFPDEPVRHKALDLIGDLYLVGMPIEAHIVAIKSGHALNLELVRKLKETV